MKKALKCLRLIKPTVGNTVSLCCWKFSLSILLCVGGLSLHAQTNYSTTISTTGVTSWTNLTWTPEGSPGSEDHVSLNSTGTGNAHLRLNSNLVLGDFSVTSSSLFLIQSEVGTGITSLEVQKLSYAGMNNLSFYNRTDNDNDNHKLSVLAASLEIGGTVSGSSAINLGTSSLPLTSFTVSGTSHIDNNGVLRVQTSTGVFSLGDVLLTGELNLANTAGANDSTAVVAVTGLSGGGSVKAASNNARPVLKISRADTESASEFSGTFTETGSARIKVEKSGTGTQIFANATGAAYSGGTSIEAGTLVISNTSNSGLGTGDVEIGNGGTLAGSGIVRLSGSAAVTVRSGGVLAPGGDGNGELNQLKINGLDTTGGVSLESGSAFTFNVETTGDSDQIWFGHYTLGDLSLAAEGIAVNVNGTLSENIIYTLFTFNSGDASSVGNITSGLTGGLVAGSGFEGYTAIFHYDDVEFGGLGTISLTVQAIPEPKQVVLVGALILSSLIWKMRRQKRAYQVSEI